MKIKISYGTDSPSGAAIFGDAITSRKGQEQEQEIVSMTRGVFNTNLTFLGILFLCSVLCLYGASSFYRSKKHTIKTKKNTSMGREKMDWELDFEK